MFSVHTKTELALSNTYNLESVLGMLRFRGGLVWTEGLTAELNKATFSNSPGVV